MTEEQMRQAGEARKARSIARLKLENVPTIDHLPWIECDPAELKSAGQIARRTIVISPLAVYAEPNGMPKELVYKHLDLKGVNKGLTSCEHAFLDLAAPCSREPGSD